MASIEEGNTPSFRWSKSNMRVIEKYNLQDNSPSSVLNRGIEAIDKVERIKRKKEDVENGSGNLAELLKKIEEL